MRKILSLILLSFLLVGCTNVSHDNNRNKQEDKEIFFAEIKWCDTDWSQIQFPIELNEDALKNIKPVETKQIAIEIGKELIKALQRDGRLSEYKLLSVIHSTEDNVWRFEYSIDQRSEYDELIEYATFYVAIDGNRGELIKAWIVEG